MKELVMEVKHFFNIEKRGIKYTVLGGQIACNKLKNGETVEIVCPGDALITNVEEIKCYSYSVDEVPNNFLCGLVFFGIHHMAFRTTEPVVNPYSPKDDLVRFLEWDRQENDAEGVKIYREVCDDTFAKEGSERDSEGNHPKPNFLFRHGSE
jgi:hypothetical protein